MAITRSRIKEYVTNAHQLAQVIETREQFENILSQVVDNKMREEVRKFLTPMLKPHVLAPTVVLTDL